MAGIQNVSLYTHTNIGTKYLISSLTRHTSRAIELLGLYMMYDPTYAHASGLVKDSSQNGDNQMSPII